jgi:hypothetical protein
MISILEHTESPFALVGFSVAGGFIVKVGLFEGAMQHGELFFHTAWLLQWQEKMSAS